MIARAGACDISASRFKNFYLAFPRTERDMSERENLVCGGEKRTRLMDLSLGVRHSPAQRSMHATGSGGCQRSIPMAP